MSAAMTALRLERVVVPRSIDAVDARPFLAMIRLANVATAHDIGHHDLDEDPQDLLGFWQDDSDWTHIGYVVERAGEAVGALRMLLSNETAATAVECDLFVAPEHRGEGVEDALLAQAERTAREQGRSVVQAWTLHRPDTPGARLTASTGWGSVPSDDPHARFFQANGFTLEQVERNSAFDLTGSFDAVERMLGDALAVAGDDYRVVLWTAPTPEEHVDSFAHVLSRMSTDAPQGGLDIAEEHWNAERVRRRDARMQVSGLTVSVAAVEHIPTRSIVAYNELTIATDHAGTTQQFGTLVIREHRGRRLGTIVKCANLLRWRNLVPESPRVSTFNAEENRHMLGINEAIGFAPISYAGAWKKALV